MNHLANTFCTWNIQVNEGSKISIYFDIIDIENSNECNNSFIEVFDGQDTSGLSIKKLCGISNGSLIESLTNNIFIRMNLHNDSVGFSLRYKGQCNITLDYATGIIESPHYPNNYPNNINCVWYINAPRGQHVVFKFETFDTAEFDCLIITSVDENNKELGETLGPFCDVYLNNLTTKYNLVSFT